LTDPRIYIGRWRQQEEITMTIPMERKKRQPRKPPPALDLTPEMVKEPTLFTLDVIKAVMFWPHDDASRRLAMQLAILQARRDYARKGQLSQSQMQELLNDAFDILPQAGKFIIEAEKDRITPGACAGEILLQKLGLAKPLETIKEEVGRGLLNWRRTRVGKPVADEGLSSKTVNNIWGQFLPVAHFWAAFRLIGNLRDFPCRRDNVGHFLRVADRLRRKGEETRLLNRQLLLRPGASVVLPEFMFAPEFLQLFPDVGIEFAPD
jgi:hypothetical protein